MARLQLDGLSLLVITVSLLVTAVAVVYGFATGAAQGLSGERDGEEAYYALMVALAGAVNGLACATDLFNLWLWVEALVIASFLLVAFYVQKPAALEATFKYLVQSVVGSILALMGVALVLAQLGTLDLALIREQAGSAANGWTLVAAGALFLVGLGVKAAVVPMHTWLPDTYAQSPTGVSAVLAGIVTKAGLVVLVRVLAAFSGLAPWGLLLLLLGAANMLLGNLLALRQTQVKRLLAYSSLSQVGFIVLAFGITVMTGDAAGAQGGFLHLINHALMVVLAFLAAGVIALHLQGVAEGRGALLNVQDLSGAGWRYPLLGLGLAVALFSLAGIPPLAGFLSKWQILAAGVAAGGALMTFFVLFALFNSFLSLGYYLPVVGALYQGGNYTQPEAVMRDKTALATVLILLLTLCIVLFGLWPELVLRVAEAAGAALLSGMVR
jgi:proton-translocating NADH-quinone oxidoreductase chain N